MKKILAIAALVAPMIAFAAPAHAQTRWYPGEPNANNMQDDQCADPSYRRQVPGRCSGGNYNNGGGYNNGYNNGGPSVVAIDRPRRMHKGDVCYDGRGVPFSYIGDGHYERFPGAQPVDMNMVSLANLCGFNGFSAVGK